MKDTRAGTPVAGVDLEAKAFRVGPHRRNPRRYFSEPEPSTEPPVPICTRVGVRSSGFGIRTSSTPRSKPALTASASMPRGSVSERLKLPKERSTL